MRPGISDELTMHKPMTQPAYTFADLRRLALSARVAATISLGTSLAIILITVLVYYTPAARHHLDRISFRLLFCIMILECVYDAAWIGLFHDWPTFTPPEHACAFGMYTLFGTMASINYLCACIAINLALTVVFNLNPRKRHFERWYLGGSLFLGFGVIIVPTALGHFGKNTSRGGKNSFCWFKQVPDEGVKIMRYYLDFYIWQCLSALVACIFVVMLIYKLWRQGRRGSRLALAGLTIDLSPDPVTVHPGSLRVQQPGMDHERPCDITLVDPFAPATSLSGAGRESLQLDILPPQDPKSPAFPILFPLPPPPAPAAVPLAILADTRRFSRARRFGSVSVTESQATRVNSLNQLHSKLHGIILRVSAYPVALVIVNILHTVPDIYLVTHGGVHNASDWRIYCIFTFLYGGRGLVFALLMIFVDPSLRKGAKTMWNVRVRKRCDDSDGGTSYATNGPHTPRMSTVTGTRFSGSGSDGLPTDPVLALTSITRQPRCSNEAIEEEEDRDRDSIDIFEFFAAGPSSSGRNSAATGMTESTSNTAKSVRIASTSLPDPADHAAVAAMGLGLGRRRLQRVEEDAAEEEKAEKWFSHVNSLL